MRRMRRSPLLGMVTTVLLGLCGGCAVGDEEAEAFSWRTEALDSGGTIVIPDDTEPSGNDDGGGGRTGGDWIINGLAEPSVSGVSPVYPLDSPQGLGSAGWLVEGDPAGETLIRYLVECALDEGESVTVVRPGDTGDEPLEFPGRLGLAPEWKTSPCNETCQQWVSACLLARTNESGAEVLLFVQGEHSSLGFGVHPEFTLYEGTFFGNVFTDPASMYACQGQPAAVAAAEQQGRTCTQSQEECGFTTFSNCVVGASCEVGPSGVATEDCQPYPGGPLYPGIAVSLAAP